MTCIAYGTFDGVHKGHRAIAEKLAQIARERDLFSIIVTVPKEKEYLTSEKEKEFLLGQTGVDRVISYTGEDNLRMLLEDLEAKVLVVGENHKNLEQVKEDTKELGVELVICKLVSEDEEIITGEMVKQALLHGNMQRVEKLCGYPYIMCGTVEHGKGLGKKAGMPTANLKFDKEKLKPANGVYATTGYLNRRKYRGLTNAGKRPTVDDFDYTTIETFFLEFEGNLYEKEILIEFQKYIRDIRKFDDLSQVQAQIQKDIEVAYSIFKTDMV